MTRLTFKAGQPSHNALGKLIVCFVTPRSWVKVCVCFWASVCVSFVCVQLIAGGGEIRSRFPKYWSISFLSPYIRKCCETYGANLRAKKNNCHLCICLQVGAGSCVCMYV